jgi:hypothetical protein
LLKRGLFQRFNHHRTLNVVQPFSVECVQQIVNRVESVATETLDSVEISFGGGCDGVDMERAKEFPRRNVPTENAAVLRIDVQRAVDVIFE